MSLGAPPAWMEVVPTCTEPELAMCGGQIHSSAWHIYWTPAKCQALGGDKLEIREATSALHTEVLPKQLPAGYMALLHSFPIYSKLPEMESNPMHPGTCLHLTAPTISFHSNKY